MNQYNLFYIDIPFQDIRVDYYLYEPTSNGLIQYKANFNINSCSILNRSQIEKIIAYEDFKNITKDM